MVLEKAILLIVEAALELVPKRCRNHPSVVKYARRRGKKPSEVLLDRSYHHAAMKELPQAHKRGRPDIVHFSLLEALGSPLNKVGRLETYVHTLDNYLIHVNPWVRLPRNYDRFKGLIEQLYMKGIIVSEDGEELLSVEKRGLRDFIELVSPSRVFLLAEEGRLVSLTELGGLLAGERRPLIMVGGFPHGRFSDETSNTADVKLSIYSEPLDAWTVVARVLCSIESRIIDMRSDDSYKPVE